MGKAYREVSLQAEGIERLFAGLLAQDTYN